MSLNVASLKRMQAKLRSLPRVVAQRVTQQAAPTITALGRATFAAGQTAYGDPWAPGADGQRITMRATGALASRLMYVAIGTKLRVALGVPYAKYQIGRRPVFPRQGAALPVAYVQRLRELTSQTIRAELGAGGA